MVHDPQERPVDILEAAAAASVWLASLVSFEYVGIGRGGRIHRAAWPQDAPIHELPLFGDMVCLHGIQAAAATATAAAAAVADMQISDVNPDGQTITPDAEAAEQQPQ